MSASDLELLYASPERCSYERRGDNELLLGCTRMGGSARPLILRRYQ
ncbi:MAG TPA: hypothetical protein VHP33_00730 [Polyangiaceae bacterium]|nr:hypothetical protein [Polyangiaceae bacterium]